MQYSDVRRKPDPRLGQIQRGEVDLVPLVQPLQSFERPNLAAPARWMQKIRFHPQDFHASASGRGPRLLAQAGEK